MQVASGGTETQPRLARSTARVLEVGHDDPDSSLGWCEEQSVFEFGPDLILGGLDRLRDRP